MAENQPSPRRRFQSDDVRTPEFHQRKAIDALTGASINLVIFIVLALLLLVGWLFSWYLIAKVVIAAFAVVAGLAAVVDWLALRRHLRLLQIAESAEGREPPAIQH